MTCSADEVEAAFADLDVPAGLVRATPEDIPRLHALSFRRDQKFHGVERHTLEDITRDFSKQPSRHWFLPDADGNVVAWVGGLDLAGIQAVFGWFESAGDVDDATGRPLVRFAVEVARRLNPHKSVHIGADTREIDQIRWIEEAGGKEIRRFGRMEVPLDAAGEHAKPPEIPAGVEVRLVEDTLEDWHILHDVIDTAFADHFGHVQQDFDTFYADEREWINDYSLCWLASVDGTPAAALLGKQRPSSGYVGVLGTLKEFRGRGVGKLLLRVSFAEFARRGETLASLNVDQTNPTGAVGVYESVGMTLVESEVSYEFPSLDEVSAQTSVA